MMPDKCKKCFQIPEIPKCTSYALLIVRLVMGIAFIYHGWGKIQAPMSWMPPEAPIPGFLQLLAAVSEFGGGIALVIGLLTRLAMLGLAVTMLVAASMHAFVMKDPFVAMGPGQGSYELPLLYFTLCLLFLVMGPGVISADAKVFGFKTCTQTPNKV